MHIQGREFRFEGLNITVAYFSDEPDKEFDEKVPAWLGDDWPFDDTFNDYESFTFRKARGALIVAVENLTVEEMKFVNELVSESVSDHIKLLICGENAQYQRGQFDAVIKSPYNLVSSIYDLAFAIYTLTKHEEGKEQGVSDLATAIRQSRNGYLARYWEDQKDKNRIDPCDLIEVWPMQAEEGERVVGLWTWLNPANYRWSNKTKSNFADFGEKKLKPNCFRTFTSGTQAPERSRKPAPDVMQLIMV